MLVTTPSADFQPSIAFRAHGLRYLHTMLASVCPAYRVNCEPMGSEGELKLPGVGFWITTVIAGPHGSKDGRDTPSTCSAVTVLLAAVRTLAQKRNFLRAARWVLVSKAEALFVVSSLPNDTSRSRAGTPTGVWWSGFLGILPGSDPQEHPKALRS